jgi:2,3-bisphosphoglycerate-independent phosphoglycerate mutase
MAGRHFGPYPPSAVRPALAERNVFSRLVRAGVPREKLAFANPFPERFFRYVEALEAQGRQRRTATTFCCLAAGVRLRTGADLRRGEAVPPDFSGALWPEPDPPPPVAPAEAGRRLARLTHGHRLTLFECWTTDKAGHSRDRARAAAVLDGLDPFLGALLDALDPATDLLVISSDHGNLEDLTVKTHTVNPVPLVAWGAGAGAFAAARTLADVTPVLAGLLAP